MKENFDFGQFPSYFSPAFLLLSYMEFISRFMPCFPQHASYKITPHLQYRVTSSLRRIDSSAHCELPLDKGPVFINMLMVWFSSHIPDSIWKPELGILTL